MIERLRQEDKHKAEERIQNLKAEYDQIIKEQLDKIHSRNEKIAELKEKVQELTSKLESEQKTRQEMPISGEIERLRQEDKHKAETQAEEIIKSLRAEYDQIIKEQLDKIHSRNEEIAELKEKVQELTSKLESEKQKGKEMKKTIEYFREQNQKIMQTIIDNDLSVGNAYEQHEHPLQMKLKELPTRMKFLV